MRVRNRGNARRKIAASRIMSSKNLYLKEGKRVKRNKEQGEKRRDRKRKPEKRREKQGNGERRRGKCLTEVVHPQTPMVLSSSNPTKAAVIAMISDSNFIPDGQISGCKGFAMEYKENALFRRSKCDFSPW